MIAGSLAAVSAVWGLAAFFVFRRFADRAALAAVWRHLYAHLLEIRLFSDEPALVWNAQKAVVADNLRFLALIAKPVLILALPFALLYGPLDSIYGWGPLAVGRSAMVTLQPAADTRYSLVAPPEIVVETPPVRAVAERQVSWRIRPLAASDGILRIGDISLRVVAGKQSLVPKRRRESTTGGGWVEVDYPKAEVAIARLALPWLAWFLIFSTLSAAIVSLRGSVRSTMRPSPGP